MEAATSASVGSPVRARGSALEPAQAAWLAVVPGAVLVVLAIVLLGPPLGHAAFAPGADRFWPEAEVAPEPVEHARYVLALLAAPLAAGAVAASRLWPVRVPSRPSRILIGTAQVATVAVLALALLAQHNVLLRSYIPPNTPLGVFGVPAIATAAALALLLQGALRRREVVERLAGLARETRARRRACAALAALLAIAWLSSAFNTDATIVHAEASQLIAWDMSETFAVLDGRTPLADFHSQYAQLMPFLAAAALRLTSPSIGAWTGTMLLFSALGLLAVYAVLRRILASSLAALAAFLAFLAGGFYAGGGHPSPVGVFSVWPMRYAAPYVLAWLTARQLDGVAPRRRRLLLVAGCLVAINNLEFGLPALGATLAALLLVDPPRSRRAALRLLGDLAVALLAAGALVSALALAHGGALPRFGLLLEFPRIYGIGGWVLEPMAPVGLYLAVYVTFVAAIVVATVRAVRGDAGAVLTGMLVWSGVFGLGAASYYVGRSDVINLIALFSAWCLALVPLTIVVVRGIVRGGARRPALPALAVLFGFALALTTVVHAPLPWDQVARLRHGGAAIYRQQDAVGLMRATATRGERVAVLAPLGPRIAYDAGVVDVAPYASAESIPTANQMDTTLAAMRAAGVVHVLLGSRTTYPAQMRVLLAAGYALSAQRGAYVMLTRAPAGG